MRSMDDLVQAKVAASDRAAGGFDRLRSFAVGQTIFGQTVRDWAAWRIDGNGAVGQTADCFAAAGRFSSADYRT